MACQFRCVTKFILFENNDNVTEFGYDRYSPWGRKMI